MPSSILITGVTGFIGNHLLDVLRCAPQGSSCKIFGTARHLGGDALSRRFVPVKWDSREPFPDGIEFRSVIHAASPASAVLNRRSPREMFEQIVQGVERLLEASAQQAFPPRVVFLSSGAVYGEMDPGRRFWSEADPVVETSGDDQVGYAAGKRAAEKMLLDAGELGICEPVIARLFSFGGRHLPLDRHFALGNFVRDAALGGPIRVRGSGNAVRSYLSGDDLARWLLAALSADVPSGTILNMGSEVEISIRELASVVAASYRELSGRPVDIEVQNMSSAIDGLDRYVPSTIRARNLLGVTETITLERMVSEMLVAAAD